MNIAYKTKFGTYYEGDVESFLNSQECKRFKKKVNLLLTSPPFPLNRKKKYGNLQGTAYIDWLSNLSSYFSDILTDDGSVVMEMGNAWEPGKPIMTTLALRTLLSFLDKGGLHLCQQFVWYNKAKLPSPAQWVNIKRCRVKDSFTNIWWMSKTVLPKADNRKILRDYSPRMTTLLKKGEYNSGKRPSEHVISTESFLVNNGGSIPSNVLISSNTHSNTAYLKYCRENNITPHPARMPIDIPEFFIKFLTDPGDLVFDPFGGSNTTGEAAEKLERKWIAVERNENYIEGSKGRFRIK